MCTILGTEHRVLLIYFFIIKNEIPCVQIGDVDNSNLEILQNGDTSKIEKLNSHTKFYSFFRGSIS